MLKRMKIGDKVEVISGQDKGKRGEILDINWDANLVKVRGVVIKARHKKTKAIGKKGTIAKSEAFFDASKVMPICPQSDRPCRVRVKVLPDGKKVRVSHRTGLEL